MNTKHIEDRLKEATKGPWHVVEAGGAVVVSHRQSTRTYNAEDDCIVDSAGREVLGVSEWIRVNESDLNFMAHAKQDVQDLLEEIKRLKMETP